MTARPDRDLTVAIDARAKLGVDGGVDQVLTGLLSGISQLGDGNEAYILLAYPESSDWLEGFVGPRCRIEVVSGRATRLIAKGRTAFRRVAGLQPPPPPESDGTIERLRADVIHFPKQRAFLTSVPSIYLPHDLQHRHHPEFFTSRAIDQRERLYSTFCRRAALVTVMTEGTRADVAEAYGIDPARIAILSWPPAFVGTPRLRPEEVERLRATMSLPARYAFFPAQTWPHKNHATLFEAIAALRKEGIEVPLVLSGRETAEARKLRRLAARLEIEHQLRWLGYVEAPEIEAVYRSAACVVYPSKFEGWGMPVLEALYFRVPLICSRFGHLPELVGDAALLVDPNDPRELAGAIRSVWCDEHIATDLASRAATRTWEEDWIDVARNFRAQYRYVGGGHLCPDDIQMLRRQGLPLVDLS
jgi:glycosyltransferase involved in cell wall biosynthesis